MKKSVDELLSRGRGAYLFAGGSVNKFDGGATDLRLVRTPIEGGFGEAVKNSVDKAVLLLVRVAYLVVGRPNSVDKVVLFLVGVAYFVVGRPTSVEKFLGRGAYLIAG